MTFFNIRACTCLLLVISFSNFSTAASLQESIIEIENRISGRIGISVVDTPTSKTWSYKGDERFPMMSTFKALVCAKLLKDAESYGDGKGLLQKSYPVEQDKLIVWSPVTEKLVGDTISLKNACEATMLTSDNTAANIILKGIGGPDKLTAFLRSIGDKVTRLDRIEPQLNEAKSGDLRDTTTPNAMVNTLHKILLGEVLSKDSALLLQTWMQDNKISGKLLRLVLPEGWHIADRTGSGENGSRSITAMIWNDSRAPLIIAIYLTETTLPHSERNQVIAEIGELLFKEFEIANLSPAY